jgi:uncharacterized surface protein with fasciclin (FAS1) repeats
LALVTVLFDRDEGTVDTDDKPDDKPGDASDDVVDTIADVESFGTIGVAIKAAGMTETLRGAGPFTVFAPTDDAFAELGETFDELLADPPALSKLLERHIVSGTLMAADLRGRDRAETVAGSSLEISHERGLRVNGARVTVKDIVATNGVLHGIEKVLAD